MNRRADNREVREEFEPARQHGVAARHAARLNHHEEKIMAALAAKPPKPSSAVNTVMPCQLLTRQGDACGRAGRPELPAGICDQHAIAIYRAVVRMGAAA